MALIINYPTAGDPFGTGFNMAWGTDTIGPFEPGTIWQIDLESPAGELLVARYERSYLDAFIFDTFRQGNQLAMAIAHPNPLQHEGDSALLRFSLVQPSFGTSLEGTVAVTLDRQTGQNAELRYWLAQQGEGSGVGLTSEEHNAVLQTNAGVLAMSVISPLDLLGGLADALRSGPALSLGSLSSSYTISGDGEIPDIGDIFHTKMGIYFVATTIPAGLGHRHGQSEEYPSRLVQWRTVHTVGGTEMVSEVSDFITHGELWRWQMPKPTRIEYSVLPGVIMTARWWQWP